MTTPAAEDDGPADQDDEDLDDAAGPDATAPVAGTRRRRDVPRAVWPALIAVGFVALIGAALLRPGGSAQAPQTEAIPGTPQYLTLLPGSKLEQRFTAMDDGLSAVTSSFATFLAQPTCTLDVSLLDESGTAVGSSTIPCADLVDGARLQLLDTTPIESSRGREFQLIIAVSPGPSTGIGVRAAPITDTVPAAVVDGTAQDHSTAIITDYGNDTFAANQIGLALDRMGQYGPAWHQPAFFVLLVLACGAALTAMALAPWRTALVLLVVFTVAKGLLWAAVVPVGHGVDEGAHIAYAQFLAVDHRIPKLGQPIAGSPYSEDLDAAGAVFRPQWAIRSDRPPYAADGEEPPGLVVLRSAIGRDHSNGDTPASAYSPAYYLAPAAIHQLVPGTIDVKVGWMRLWSVALGAVAVVAAALLGRRLFPEQASVALVFAVAVSLQPMVTAQTSIINNDALLIAAGAVCLLAGVALTDPRRDWQWPLVAGLAFGTTMLCKPLGAAFGPVLLAAFVVGRVRGARRTAWWKEVGLAALGFFVTYGWWFVFATVRGYAGIGINEDVPGENRGILDLARLQSANGFEAVRTLWTDQFWGRFDWANQPFPPPVLTVITVACLIGAALVAASAVAGVVDAWRRRAGRGPWTTPRGADLAASSGILLLAVVVTVTQLYVVLYQYFHRVGSAVLISGRYALMVAPAVLVLPVLALRRLAPRLPPLVPMTIIAASMAVLNVIGFGLLVERYYL